MPHRRNSELETGLATLRQLQELFPDLDLTLADLPPRTENLPKNQRKISEKSAPKTTRCALKSQQNQKPMPSEKNSPKNPEVRPEATAILSPPWPTERLQISRMTLACAAQEHEVNPADFGNRRISPLRDTASPGRPERKICRELSATKTPPPNAAWGGRASPSRRASGTTDSRIPPVGTGNKLTSRRFAIPAITTEPQTHTPKTENDLLPDPWPLFQESPDFQQPSFRYAPPAFREPY